MPRPIALVGLPGVGKSSIGRRLARRLGRQFVDADHAVEERLGCTIALFFEHQGESRFRDIEARVLSDLLHVADGDDAAGNDAVIATGGGVVLRDGNRELLAGRAFVVYLRSAPEALVMRLRHDAKRPLLQGGGLRERLDALHAARDPLYAGVAHLTVETGSATPAALVGAIVAGLEAARA